MEPIYSMRPLLAVLVSLFAAFIILTLDKKPNVRDAVSFIAAIIKFSIVASMAPAILAGGTIELNLFTILPGIDFKFRVDALGMVFATISSLLWIFAAVYSVGYMRSSREHRQTRFFACFAISLSAAVGGAFSANLFTLIIFYEVLSLITYPLVYHKETDESWEGSKKYVVYLVGTSKTLLLAAVALTYYFAGNLDFAPHGLLENVSASPVLLTIVYFCYLFGFAKAGVMPFHAWLPAAMVAPTPVSALLHAVAVVKMGVFCVLRVVFHVFGISLMQSLNLGIATAYIVSFTIIIASVYALTRDNLKARLAYSTVSQLSYIILGAVLLTPSSMVGGITHIASHAFSKITLFFCAGSIYCAAHKTKVSELAGIGKKLPWTMTAFFIGSLSMIGVPPAAGFISKWYIAVGSIEANDVVILAVLLISSILNAAYFLPITYKAFFEKSDDGHEHNSHGHSPTGAFGDKHEEIKEIPMVVIPLFITAILSVLMGMYPDYFITLAKEVIK
ncbi:MAG: monovalent cation/H+ antiporter subunit D family protein [Deltaproteobacteria bacterium]|nr:monovalent cation/H+ antiporter subunit D family protein [Deltaproteobacteria bacterium]